LLEICKSHAEAWKSLNCSQTIVQDSTDSAIDFVSDISNCQKLCKRENFTELDVMVEVLVTGSLHLVGNVLSILDPSLCGT
jgi:folylpolyglutamate synthase/dihydropteroate synthase